jgi:hypothetical protein
MVSRYWTTECGRLPRFHRVQNRGKACLSEQFHLQGVHSVEYTKGTKRPRPDAAARDKAPSAPYRRKRPCVNRAGVNPADALLPTMGHCFIDETAEIIKTSGLQSDPSGTKSRAEKDSEGDE